MTEGMRHSKTRRFRGELACLLISLAMTLTAGGWSVAGLIRGRKADPPLDPSSVRRVARESCTTLRRRRLHPAKQATVNCQVEDVTDSDGTMVLSVIGNGCRSKRG